MSTFTKSSMHQMNDEGEVELKVDLEGLTELPFWKHDLKMKAAIALLSTVDQKDFIEDDKYEIFEELLEELDEIVRYLRGI